MTIVALTNSTLINSVASRKHSCNIIPPPLPILSRCLQDLSTFYVCYIPRGGKGGPIREGRMSLADGHPCAIYFSQGGQALYSTLPLHSWCQLTLQELHLLFYTRLPTKRLINIALSVATIQTIGVLDWFLYNSLSLQFRGLTAGSLPLDQVKFDRERTAFTTLMKNIFVVYFLWQELQEGGGLYAYSRGC